MIKLDNLISDLHWKTRRIYHDKNKGRLSALICAYDVQKEYEKIRPEDETQLSPQEILDLMMDKVKQDNDLEGR